MNEIGNTIMGIEEEKEKYDATLKELLANKQFLARILKQFVPEFHGVSLEAIENDYIEPEIVLVANVGVERNRTNIDGVLNEDKTVNEGNINYDLVFKVCYPDKAGNSIGMYINVEIQKEYYKAYEFETRGTYYAARRFSSQLKSITKETDYRCLQKVYSIWICMGNVPNYEANTVTLYRTEKCDIIGTVKRDRSVYDLMNVIIIRINDKMKSEDEVLQLLQTLCSSLIRKEEKITLLKEQGIHIDDVVEGVSAMCNLSDLIVERTEERVQRETAINLHKNNTPVDIIAKSLKLPIETINTWIEEN